MWKVTGNGYNGEFYLLGSIHVGLDDTNLYANEVYEAFNVCDYLAVESDVIALEADFAAQTESLRSFVYTDGSKINTHIPIGLYESSRNMLKQFGLYNIMMDYYKPVLWQQLIEQSLTDATEYDSSLGVDRYFLLAAKRSGKKILEVENYLETNAALADMSEQTQIYLLEQTVNQEYVKNYADGLFELYNVWKSGNIADIEETLFAEFDESEYTADEVKSNEEYNSALLYSRNENMTDKARCICCSGKNVFYVVGLAHMVGEKGIVSSLISRGFTAEPVVYEEVSVTGAENADSAVTSVKE